MLIRDLKINERDHILNSIYHEVNKIKYDQLTANKISFGIDSIKNPLYQKFNIVNFELNEILQILENKKIDSLKVMNYVSLLKNHKNISFKNKSICIIGGNNPLFSQELMKLKAKNVLNIQVDSLLSSKNHSLKQNSFINNVFSFPTLIGNVNINNIDILIVPDPIFSSLLLKNDFYGINKNIKEAAIISLEVSSSSIFKSSPEPEIIINQDNNKIVFNDNYIRILLHKNGFFEVRSLYSFGKNNYNYFDKKISHFNYKNGLTLIKSNKFPKAKINQIIKVDSVIKIYTAYKLPINIQKK